jgi:hypothetical protein
MNTLPLIPYCAVKVPANLRGQTLNRATIKKIPDFLTQWDLIRWYAKSTNRKLLPPAADLIQSPNTKFIHQTGFRQAIETAVEKNAVVLVADFYGLLGRNNTSNTDLLQFLHSTGQHLLRIESVRDAGNPFLANPANKGLTATADSGIEVDVDGRLHCLMRLAAARVMFRSAGPLTSVRISTSGNPNPMEATRSNRNRADAFAKSVKRHIKDILQSDRPPRSLAALAESLNEKDVFTRRNKRWTPTGVKRVLERLKIDLPRAK